MSDPSYEFERFSSREGFNRSLAHFKVVSSLLSDFERGTNLADLLNDLQAEKTVDQNQLGPIVYALLVDKYGYAYRSYNIEDTISELSFVADETKKWNAVDLVCTYFHPELGLLVINPKNSRNWSLVNALKKNEVVTVFAGAFGKTASVKDPKVFQTAMDKLLEYFHGKKTAAPSSLKSGKLTYKEPKPKAPPAAPRVAAGGRAGRVAGRAGVGRPAGRRGRAAVAAGAPIAAQAPVPQAVAAAPAATQAAPPAAPEAGPKRMTPFYSVPVTNELFHNGNVEAWKKVIQSYQTKYPDLEVYIFYDGERIHDIHALFKWGKVKHGSTILFAVAGENFQDVAKLQRYLRQGASPRFEDFLRFPVNTVLKLF